jgi:predicted MPP superfamily phosphohydrolase
VSIPSVIAVAVLIGLGLFLYHEVCRFPGPKEWGRTPRWPKRIRVTLAAIPLILGLLVFYGFFIEPNRLIVRHETIQINDWPPQLNNLRIAVLSDIHAGSAFIDEDKLRLIVRRTNELSPDLIVILGDYVSGNGRNPKRMDPEVFAPILKGLHARLGVYSVLGNHDWWHGGNKVRGALEVNGIRVLEDEVIQLDDQGASFWLAGLADLWTRPQRITQTIDKIPPDQTIIALTHNPDIFPRLPARVQLLLAGHTHGGQVRLPFIGTVIEPSDYGERYVRGHVVEDGHHLFVTTGIGTSIVPVRFGVPPEIVLLTVSR